MQPLPGAKADWEILGGVIQALGLTWTYFSPADIRREIGRSTPIYAGVSRRALGESGARWPLLARKSVSGRAALAESSYLTREMLEQGLALELAADGTAAEKLVASSGRGE